MYREALPSTGMYYINRVPKPIKFAVDNEEEVREMFKPQQQWVKISTIEFEVYMNKLSAQLVWG